jgi:transposase
MDEPVADVSLDVHKDTIAVALAEADKRGEVREHGKIANTPAAVKTFAGKPSRGGLELGFCYEAGPCGYDIQRQLSAAGHGCVANAQSLIPHEPDDRVKADWRDAINLAKLHRVRELTPVWVPEQAHEAIRDLVRARLAVVRTTGCIYPTTIRSLKAISRPSSTSRSSRNTPDASGTPEASVADSLVGTTRTIVTPVSD